ncbi:MAG: hypothetical protein QOJ39_2416, partial [Candidatus Eremiobacteraeota bacterium]|nr:hypothetical protein [Candidatus Eremiobacteraeota bacterium]
RAVWDDKRVSLRYRDRDRKTTERVVDPLGLVAKAGVWYLVARTGDGEAAAAEYRTFRAERITGVTGLTQSFVRPPDFDLDAYWRRWTASVEESSQRFTVIVSVARSRLEIVSRYWEAHVLTDRPDIAAGDVAVRIIFPAEDAALHQLVAWGGIARIIEPAAIRNELVARARALVEHQT